MKSFAIILAVLLCLSGVPVRAEMPLYEVASFSIPDREIWDVQHWTDEESYGWATIDRDTVEYVFQIGQAPQRFVIPDSIFDRFVNYSWPGHERINLCKSVLAGDDPCLLILSGVEQGSRQTDYNARHVLHLWNLVTRQLLMIQDFGGDWGWTYNSSTFADYSSVLGAFALWPPPPLPMEYVLFGKQLSGSHYRMGGSHWTDVAGTTYLLSLFDSTLTSVGGSQTVLPFRDFTTLRAGLAGRSSWVEEGPWVTTFSLGDTNNVRQFGFGDLLAAQADGDGTRRLILGDLHSRDYIALRDSDFTEVWRNDAMLRPSFAFGYGESGVPELIFSYSWQLSRCFVYDPDDGLILDNTSRIEGEPQCVLRQPDRPDELLTFTENEHRIRIYRSTPSALGPTGLTCHYSAASATLTLCWELGQLADSVRIYGLERLGLPEMLIATVPATQHSVELPATTPRRFFFATSIQNR
jgi:hypothetical protein